jgi:hypothetical protein
MASPRPEDDLAVAAACHEPLFAVFLEENGREVVRYFTSEAAADAAVGPQSVAEVLAVAGAWRELDWDAMEEGLERIRRESRPSPPIDL